MRPLQLFTAVIAILTMVSILGCSTGGDKKKKPTPTEKAYLLLDIANTALLDGDATGALGYLMEAEALDSDIAEVHHSKALAFFSKRDTETAIHSAKRAVELNPDYSSAHNTLGKLLLDERRYSEAELHLRKATSNPLYREAYKSRTSLGILYYNRGQYVEAKEQFDKAIIDNPILSCVAHYYRGHIFVKRNEFKKAIRDYDRATRRLCGNYPDAHLALGIAYARKKDYTLAKKKFLEIRDMFPDSAVAEQAMERLRYLP